MLEGGIALVHVARIPLVSECRNRVHAPVDEDAELGVAKPGGHAIGGKRIPVGLKGAGVGRRGNAGKLDLQVARGLLRERRDSEGDGPCGGQKEEDRSPAATFAIHAIQASRRGAGLGIAPRCPMR